MMTEEQFDEFLAKAVEALREKQDALMNEFGLGGHEHWWFDQSTGKLQFFNDPKEILVEADALVIGTYAPEHSTWIWGWANKTLLEPLQRRSDPLKALAELTDVELFADAEEFPVDQGMEWELAAMSVAHMGLKGCYRAPSELFGHHTFLGIKSIRRVG